MCHYPLQTLRHSKRQSGSAQVFGALYERMGIADVFTTRQTMARRLFRQAVLLRLAAPGEHWRRPGNCPIGQRGGAGGEVLWYADCAGTSGGLTQLYPASSTSVTCLIGLDGLATIRYLTRNDSLRICENQNPNTEAGETTQFRKSSQAGIWAKNGQQDQGPSCHLGSSGDIEPGAYTATRETAPPSRRSKRPIRS